MVICTYVLIIYMSISMVSLTPFSGEYNVVDGDVEVYNCYFHFIFNSFNSLWPSYAIYLYVYIYVCVCVNIYTYICFNIG